MIHSFRSTAALAAFTLVVAMPVASAQDASPTTTIAPADCPKPADTAPVKAPKAEMTKYQKQIDDYKACVNAYAQVNMTKAKEIQAQAMDLQAQAQSRSAQAQVYANAANGAIDQFNNFITDVNKQRDDAVKK